MKIQNRLKILLCVLVTLASAGQAFAARNMYLTIDGSKQGKFKGDTSGKEHQGQIAVVGFNYEIDSPTDTATGLPTGKTQKKPLSITKDIDAATPELFQAISTHELLKSVVLEIYQMTPKGIEEPYYTIKLTDAYVSKVHQGTGLDLTETAESGLKVTNTRELEEVSFTYQKIEVQHNPSKTESATDTQVGR